jgi:hypothetical protein
MDSCDIDIGGVFLKYVRAIHFNLYWTNFLIIYTTAYHPYVSVSILGLSHICRGVLSSAPL